MTANLVEATNKSPNLQYMAAKTQSAIFVEKMEMTMRKKILTLVVIPLIAALTAQAAAASERHHARTKGRAVTSEQFRNSNAYAAPDHIAVPSYWSNEAEGAMASGIAGH